MSKTREPGQGAAEGLLAATNIYAPPAANQDSQRLQPAIPIHLLLGFVFAVVLLLASLVSWLVVGFADLFPLIATPDTFLEGWVLMGYVNFLNIPLLFVTAFALALGMAVWQGCAFASLRRA